MSGAPTAAMGLRSVVHEVIGGDLQATGAPLPSGLGSARRVAYLAFVDISGDSHARLYVESDECAGQEISVRIAGEAGDTEEVLDCVTEVANQIAGGVKSLLDGECDLNVPHASLDADLILDREPDATEEFLLGGGSVRVSLFVEAPGT